MSNLLFLFFQRTALYRIHIKNLSCLKSCINNSTAKSLSINRGLPTPLFRQLLSFRVNVVLKYKWKNEHNEWKYSKFGICQGF